MKTMVAVLTQGINLEIHPNVIFVSKRIIHWVKTVQMHIEVNKQVCQTRSTNLEASDSSQNQAEGTQEADIQYGFNLQLWIKLI